jgi:hypothetical protein
MEYGRKGDPACDRKADGGEAAMRTASRNAIAGAPMLAVAR